MSHHNYSYSHHHHQHRGAPPPPPPAPAAEAFSVPSGWGGGGGAPAPAPSQSDAPPPPPPPPPPSYKPSAATKTFTAKPPTITEVTNRNVGDLRSEQFRTPEDVPNPLCVKPPTIPAKYRRPESRWSSAKYCNPDVPNYVPPELMLFGDGNCIEAFLQRARIEDLKRMLKGGVEGLYFMRHKGELPPGFKGSPHDAMQSLLEEKMKEFHESYKSMNKAENEKFRSAAGGGDGDGGDGERRATNKIVREIYFTRSQLETGVYGCLFGSRGATQKALQAETGCKIVLGGRGITSLKNASSLKDIEAAKALAEKDPHVAITAPNEAALQQAVQKIEFLLSDDPEAVRMREANKRKGAVDSGLTYRPPKTTTTTTTTTTGAGAGGDHGGGGSRTTTTTQQDAVADAEVEDFLKTL